MKFKNYHNDMASKISLIACHLYTKQISQEMSAVLESGPANL